ncbi:MAG: glycosyl hydrolase [Candidatus Nanopelagicales bacterium]
MRASSVVVAVLVPVVLLGGAAAALSTRTDPAPCPAPVIAPVDPAEAPSALCAAGRLDAWQAQGVMAIGQQLDVQEEQRMRQPLESLEPSRPAVVGFDFAELLNALAYFDNDPVPYLAGLFESGSVLTATWHADNPGTDGDYADRTWTDLAQLLDPATPAAAAYWTDYDRLLEQALRLQEAGAAVVFKPLHEASGGWFWWGRPDPATYRALFAAMQERAAARGVHNLLWAYAANPRVYAQDLDPLALLPASIDLGGLDVYDVAIEQPWNRVTTTDFRRLAAKVPRMAFTEVGPYRSTTGDWSPKAITDTLRSERLYAAFALLWRDDPEPGFVYQVSSLTGGQQWLAGCPGGLCPLVP